MDGIDITKEERIRAAQRYHIIRKRLLKEQEEKKDKKKSTEYEPRYNEKGEKLYGYDPQSRLESYKEMCERRKRAGATEEKTVDAAKIGEIDRYSLCLKTHIIQELEKKKKRKD